MQWNIYAEPVCCPITDSKTNSLQTVIARMIWYVTQLFTDCGASRDRREQPKMALTAARAPAVRSHPRNNIVHLPKRRWSLLFWMSSTHNYKSVTNTSASKILAIIHIPGSLKLFHFHFPILQLNGTGRSHIIRYPSANNTEDEDFLNNAWIKVLMIKMRAVFSVQETQSIVLY